MQIEYNLTSFWSVWLIAECRHPHILMQISVEKQDLLQARWTATETLFPHCALLYLLTIQAFRVLSRLDY